MYEPYNAFAGPSNGGFAPKGNQKLHAGAHVFNPTGPKPAPVPIRILNRDSTADEQPTIVTSPTPAVTTSNKTNGKGNAATAQQPIGTRNGNITPPRPRVYFTTDVGPDVPFQGGHYIKIENISKKELENTLNTLSDDVSLSSQLSDPNQADIANSSTGL